MYFKEKDSTGQEHDSEVSVHSDEGGVWIWKRHCTSGNLSSVRLTPEQLQYVLNELEK